MRLLLIKQLIYFADNYVFSGKLPVFCLPSNNSDNNTVVSPINIQISLYESTTDDGNRVRDKLIALDRYDYQGVCLWMESLQEVDNGKYTMQMKSCIPLTNITIFVNVTRTGNLTL